MSADTITAFSAAVVAVIGAVTALIVALRPMLSEILAELRASREELVKNTDITQQTHVMVNNKSDEQTSRLDQLTQSIVDLGGNVPIDPAIAAAQRRVADHVTDDEGNHP